MVSHSLELFIATLGIARRQFATAIASAPVLATAFLTATILVLGVPILAVARFVPATAAIPIAAATAAFAAGLFFASFSCGRFGLESGGGVRLEILDMRWNEFGSRDSDGFRGRLFTGGRAFVTTLAAAAASAAN